jgi:hypothetical protein
MIEACHFIVVPSRSSSMPLYPYIVLRTRERAPTPYPSAVFNLGLTFESRKELGVRHPFGNPRTKCNLDVAPMERRRVYYKGEGSGFLQVQAVVSFVNLNSPVGRPSTKVLKLCINQLIV